MTSLIGQTLSHYTILEKLGEGGMGVVYRARDTKLDRDVALKFLPPSLTASDEEVARFEQEARAISALNHPAIATIYDVDEAGGQKFLALEYLPGGTLKSRLKQLKSDDRQFTLREVTSYGIQIAEALAHAHRHGIIHRDVKTDNIMLTEEGTVKLADFGLAKLRGNVQITKAVSTVGTAAYMSPEQIGAEELDQRTDIFSLGIVLYELLASRLPFRGDFEAALTYSILHDDPPPITSVRPDVPVKLEQIVMRCLEKEKDKRYPSASEMASDLRTVERDLAGPQTKFTAKRPLRWITGKKRIWIPAAVIVLLAAIVFFYPRIPSSRVKGKSIAVLPFENMSDNKDDEYFSDGITDDIIAQLSKISDLKVISRTSVMPYKGAKKNVREIGHDLGVATVLEGSVRRSGSRVRIVAQLIDARNEGHLWVETFDKEMTEVFAIQSEVAERIAVALQAKLSPSERGRLEKSQTQNTEAYQLYLRGRFYWNRRTPDDLETAIKYFEQAIEKDPQYAQAYAAMASACVVLPQFGVRPADWYGRAENAAKKALGIDSTLAEAYTVLGLVAAEHGWDWVRAEQLYRRAIGLEAGYPTVHQWHSICLTIVGRLEEALTEARRAKELDPLSPVINLNVGDVLTAMGRYDEAWEQYQTTLALDPNFPWVHNSLGSFCEMQGRLEEAVAQFEKTNELAGSAGITLAALGRIYGKVGRRSDAQKVLDRLLRLSEQGVSVSGGIASVYYGLGDREKTFEWLEKAYQAKETDLLYLSYDPLWKDLRSDARCVALLKKMGLAR